MAVAVPGGGAAGDGGTVRQSGQAELPHIVGGDQQHQIDGALLTGQFHPGSGILPVAGGDDQDRFRVEMAVEHRKEPGVGPWIAFGQAEMLEQ